MKSVLLTLAVVIAALVQGSPVRSSLGAERNSGRSKQPLGPYDSEVEYLENTGMQYIDAGYETTGTGIGIDIVASKTTSNVGEMAVVGRTLSSGCELYFLNNKINLWNNKFTLTSGIQVAVDTKYHIVAVIGTSNQSLTVNGETETRTGEAGETTPGSVTIFRHAGRYIFIGRVYSCKIYGGDELVRDFIPVKFTNELGQAEGAMFDKVSGLLFMNAGTGAFVIGPEV